MPPRRGRGAQPQGAQPHAPATLADLPEACLVRILEFLDSDTERWGAAGPPGLPCRSSRRFAQRGPTSQKLALCSLPWAHKRTLHSLILCTLGGRARAGGVCKAFCAATRNPKLWTKLTVKTANPEIPGQLLNWLLRGPRRQQLETMDLWGEFAPGLAAWSSMLATALCAASTLRDLTLVVNGELEIGAWIAPLTGLTSVYLESGTASLRTFPVIGSAHLRDGG